MNTTQTKIVETCIRHGFTSLLQRFIEENVPTSRWAFRLFHKTDSDTDTKAKLTDWVNHLHARGNILDSTRRDILIGAGIQSPMQTVRVTLDLEVEGASLGTGSHDHGFVMHFARSLAGHKVGAKDATVKRAAFRTYECNPPLNADVPKLGVCAAQPGLS